MPEQIAVPCTFIRGGTSKGLFFRWEDVPSDVHMREKLFCAALGSPDPNGRQLDGMGGGASSVSKVMVVRRSERPGIEVDYQFCQVSIDTDLVDTEANCGNLSAAVGVFAVNEGMVRMPDGQGTIAMYNENTCKRVDCHLEMRNGQAAVTGAFEIDGVHGGGAPIKLDFIDPGGAVTGNLLPTGNPVDRLYLKDGETVDVSIVDATNPMVFLSAADAGVTGTEMPHDLANQPNLLAWLDEVRVRAASLAGIGAGDAVPASVPKIATVAPPVASLTLDGRQFAPEECDVQIRMISMGAPHMAIPLTGALCTAVAARIEGTIVNQNARAKQAGELLRVVHGSGVVSVLGEVRRDGDGWHALSASVMRTARPLMHGTVLIPAPRVEDVE